MINNLYLDYGFISLNKYSEELCGDHVEVCLNDNDLHVMVLADGLGSGVKANILSVLTSKMAATMFHNNIDIASCLSTIAQTLPICQERHLAYSTFSIVRVNNNNAEIIEYDNPLAIILRNGKNYQLTRNVLEIDKKSINTAYLRLEEGDIIVLLSDGAIHAGIGMNLNFGWERKEIISFLEENIHPNLSAKTIATILSNKCNELYGNEPGDDTTIAVIKVTKRKSVNLLIGPALNKEDDNNMMRLFFSKEGIHIVSGGTTATIAARYLGKEIDNSISLQNLNPLIPPISHIEGVDLVTEGVITINQVLTNVRDYSKENILYDVWNTNKDGASQLTSLLINEATDINFYVGKAVNPAHQNAMLNIDFSLKMKLIEELSIVLREIGKRIIVNYF